jgi:phosphoribosyl 1,2-cyclic phosphodiesterase
VRLCVLSSGSGGNCLYVEAGSSRVLIDAGLPLRETVRRCREAGIDPRSITDVFLTHEHADHAGGAGVLSRKLGVCVHATRGTLRNLRDEPCRVSAVRAGEVVRIGSLRITPVAVPHDAHEPVAYVFDDGETRAGLVTDLGCAPMAVARAFRNLDALVLEMNHDPRLLIEGPYPWSLKRRIQSDVGHLSNEQGARLLSQVFHAGLGLVVLAHLSEHNNTERHALRAAGRVLEKRGASTKLCVASQARALDPFILKPSRAVPQPYARQLALFA